VQLPCCALSDAPSGSVERIDRMSHSCVDLAVIFTAIPGDPVRAAIPTEIP